jgi:hypothetical protein
MSTSPGEIADLDIGGRASDSLAALIRAMLWTGVVFVLVGVVIAFVRHGELPTVTSSLRDLPLGLFGSSGAAWLTLGILTFLATPPLLIGCLLFCFFRAGDRLHAAIAGAVLALLLSSLATTMFERSVTLGPHMEILPLLPEVGVLVAALAAGALGATLGLGGGVFIVPILSVFFGVPLKTSIAASAVSVVVNSLGGTSVYLRHRMTNVRLALFMELTTVVGAVVGGVIVVIIAPDVLRAVFGVALIALAVATLIAPARSTGAVAGPDRLGLRGGFRDLAKGGWIDYVPQRLALGASVSTLAGVVSGMLGIGGGAVKMPLLHTIMQVPVKAAAATSMLMVGITVSASAYVYYAHGLIDLSVTVPAVLGIQLGSNVGANAARKARSTTLVRVLVVILVYLGVVLLLQSLGIHVPGAAEKAAGR